MLKYCPHCGKPLPEQKDQQKIKEATKKAHKKKPQEKKEPGLFGEMPKPFTMPKMKW